MRIPNKFRKGTKIGNTKVSNRRASSASKETTKLGYSKGRSTKKKS